MKMSQLTNQLKNLDYGWWSSVTPLVNRGIIPVPMPFSLTLVVTKRCNSRCSMCYIWKINERDELSLEELRRIFTENDFSSLTSLTLTGGEPTLRNDLPQILKIVQDACPRLRQVTLATSGLNTNLTIELVRGCLDVLSSNDSVERFSVQISLDGVGELHDRIRGIPGYFKRVLKTISLLKELALENKRLVLKLSSTVQPANVDAVSSTQALAKELNLPMRFGALVYSSSYYQNSENIGNLNYSPEQARKAATFFSNLANEDAGSNVKFYYRDAAKMVEGALRSKVCMMGYYGFVLENNGTIYPCVNCETKAFGNLRKQTFREIWWGANADRLRREIRAECCPTCASICYSLPGNVVEVIDTTFHRIIKT
jgi:MoaA/NifB/PqqE/SkfB family radical SAM enzyme